MPRNYIRKKVSTYDQSALKLAIADIENGLKLRVAAKKHSVPKETLRRWVTKPPGHQGSGRNTALSHNEELCIVTALKFLGDCGFPFDRQDVLNIVKEYLSVNNKVGVSSLGIEWLLGFEKRWGDQLTKRKPELLTQSRAEALLPDVVNEFFRKYIKLIDDNNLRKCPTRIFNLDEVGFSTDPRASKVFVSKGSRNTYLTSSDAGKAMYSVLFCISASGTYMPPFTIYKSVHLYDSWTDGGTKDAYYGCSKSGWMEGDIFESWMGHFVKFVEALQKPVLLVYDGHGSHLTYKTVKTALDNGVIILCLPPNTSHALQPLDVGVFAPAKKSWRLILKKWFRETRLQKISKAVFPSLLKQLFEKMSPEYAINGFKGAGLFPPNKKEVEHRIVLTKKVTSTTDLEPIASSSSLPVEPIASSSSLSVKVLASSSLLQSPFKDLKSAILSTLSPVQSKLTKAAMANSKRKRKRVQHKDGEVITNADVVERLKEEERHRTEKKKLPTKRQKKTQIREEEVPEQDTKPRNIMPGTWVVVAYKSKKSILKFVGQVTSIHERLIDVKFVTKSKLGNFYVYPEKDDVDMVDIDDVKEILEDPFCNNRQQYFFQNLTL